MMRSIRLLAAAAAFAVTGCASGVGGGGFGNNYYSLVQVRPMNVGDGSLTVTAPRPWNEARRRLFDDVRWVEDWTLNGPILDGMTFVSGLPSGKYLVRQSRRDERQVPIFRSNMLAPEIASMLESAYRVRGGAVEFRTLGLTPRPFLGANGFQYDFEHLDSDELWRKGRAVGAVIDGRLYLILFDAARSHYYANAIGDFEAIATSARRRR
ncbi:MAG: hypothetical protein M3Q52_00940 [Pseudomonadota bacterium]|nr:hypothetical protein [Pseudomonadota bacterium]